VADEGGVTRAEIQAVMEFNALCDWEHAIDKRGRASAADLAVLEAIPRWPSFRGREHTRYVVDAIEPLKTDDLRPLRAHMSLNC
jgi:hypothetical protein